MCGKFILISMNLEDTQLSTCKCVADKGAITITTRLQSSIVIVTTHAAMLLRESMYSNVVYLSTTGGTPSCIPVT